VSAIVRSPNLTFAAAACLSAERLTHLARTPNDNSLFRGEAVPEPRMPSVGSMLDLAVE
jgi:hypothetical protein